MKFAVRKRRAPTIIIVSLVDILTILLIFFVVSTTFKKDQPEVQINLPESKTATNAPAETEHAIVTVNQSDEIMLDNKAIAVDQLEAAVRDLPDKRRATLALQADKKASFGIIIKVMDALKLAGVRNLPAFTRGENEIADCEIRRSDPARQGPADRRKSMMRLRALASDMLETMHAANGVGLAAQQIGEALAAHSAGYFASRGSSEHTEIEWERGRSHRVDAAGPDQSASSISVKRKFSGRKVASAFPTSRRMSMRAVTVTARAKTLEGEEIADRSERLARARVAARSRSSQRHSVYRSNEFRGQSESRESIEANAERERAIAGKILAESLRSFCNRP